jgi:hypothetical protein
MFRFFRRHRWILIVALSLTVISFLFFFSPSQRMNNGGSGYNGTNDLGKIYGQKITSDEYLGAKREFYLFYLFHYGTWPDKSLSENDLDREIYIRLLLMKKAAQIGIYVNDDAAAVAANQMLHSQELVRALHINGDSVPLDVFVKQVLQPQGLSADDFESFARHDLVIQQLVQTMGLSGALVTPQEATAVYSRENQEISAQIIYFSATNYLSRVAVTPAALTHFYTNYLAAYRLPDRVQVSYVAFNVTNFLAQSKAEWAKTNFDQQIDAIYLQYGAQSFPDAKTPAEGKAKLREILIRQRALADARVQANEFASAVFNLDPAKPENLATVAKQKGLTVKTTAPFGSQSSPQEFSATEDFTKAAFNLSPDEPFAGPIVTSDAVYVIAFAGQLPSEIPPFAEISSRVTQDFQMQQAVALAQQAGTNFAYKLIMSMAAGKSFASASVAAGLSPQVLPPFSLSTRELPEFGDRIGLNQLKQAAFTTPVGHASAFEPTVDGGFILFVQSQSPVDQSALNTDLPQFINELRRSRQGEAFQQWLNVEANHELRDTPLAREAAAKQP